MNGSNRSGGKQNSAVGYRRPPVSRQFKPGQSGNPKGRPKGRKNFTTIFVDVLSRRIKVRDKNRPRTLSKLEAMIEIMTNKAVAGDPHAFARIVQIAERLDAFKWQPPDAYDSGEGALEYVTRKLEALAEAHKKENSESTEPSRASTQNDARKK